MSRTLWMGDVQDNWTEDYICALMRNAKGLVSVKLMRDRATNEPLGFGFIDFATEEDAINGMNGYNGRPIPGTGFTFRFNFGGNTRSMSAADNYCLYIGELETSITDSQLYSLFKDKYISFCGAKIMREGNASKGFGFLQFRARDEAEKALKEMNGYIINGRAIRLSYASARRWANDGDSKAMEADSKYSVIMEGPEIPNIKPPPPTRAMIAKSLVDNTNGLSSMVDAYGNTLESSYFTHDPEYQAALQRKKQERLSRMALNGNLADNDTEVPSDWKESLDVKQENRRFIESRSAMFDLPKLVAPQLKK